MIVVVEKKEEKLTIRVPLCLISCSVRLTLKGTMTPLASQKSSLTHFMVAGHSVIGNELVIESTLDDSGELWLEKMVGLSGIGGMGQHTPVSQGRRYKAKFRMG